MMCCARETQERIFALSLSLSTIYWHCSTSVLSPSAHIPIICSPRQDLLLGDVLKLEEHAPATYPQLNNI
ncbi:hypothetical protein L6164_035331 [Bauhinia variegata]|uniref:Uncharacterized protein n=1 Tax=Bauhinia variegata TaxID=167791 RepID=A0ACB9KDL7_BAUVA|nr:hypothetical protein L6164_035331 [Bauhinia variegata]